MKTATVTVVPYDPTWKEAFEAIKQELEAAIGPVILGIEHVGSTAVEGMSAKPCIDIDVIIPNHAALEEAIRGLSRIGYVHEGDLGIRDREAFTYADKPHLQKHHLYVCLQHSAELHRHITFRNFLRSHPEAVLEYSRIKTEAAKQFPHDIDRYIAFKSPYIEKLYRQCGLLKD